jgi:hypothetical protein
VSLSKILRHFSAWALAKNRGAEPYREGDLTWAHIIGTPTPYMTRVRSAPIKLPLIGELQLRLHHFHRPDIGPHLHNHPFRWSISLVLTGAYEELRLRGAASIVRRVRHFNVLTDHDYHMIRRLHGDVWTLFVVGPRVQRWGFLVNGRHIDSSDYLHTRSQ